MQLFTVLLFITTLFIGQTGPLPEPGGPDKEVFAGTTPCGQLIRPLNNIAPAADCALVEWELTLLRDPITHMPATFRLVANNHYILPDNNYSQPGTKSEATGKWSIVKGTGSFAHTEIYQLAPTKSGSPLRFVKLGGDLLHLLDAQGRYMRGDPMQSYTLNRINK